MIAISIIIVLILLAIILPEENILLFVLFTLPFHSLLKSLYFLYFGQSTLISLWKEIVLFILFVRIAYHVFLTKDRSLNYNYPIGFIIFYILLSSILFVFAFSKQDALTSYKIYTFPLLCLFIAMHINVSNASENKILRVITYSSLLVFILGYMQQYYFKIEFAILMKIFESFGTEGELVFAYTAAKIEGIERMYGSFVGPNELGLYTSLILSVLLYRLLIQNYQKGNRLILIVFTMGIFTLILTYSRVSWFIFFLVTCYYIFQKSSSFKYLFWIFILSLCIFSLANILIPEFVDILEKSVTLQESSASSRADEFINGLSNIVQNPIGLGLGAIQYGSTNQIFHTEIFWWLVLGEEGIIIGGMLLSIYINFAYKLLRQSKINAFSKVMPIYLTVMIIAGFGSAILFEPIYQVILWIFVGLSFNSKLNSLKT